MLLLLLLEASAAPARGGKSDFRDSELNTLAVESLKSTFAACPAVAEAMLAAL
jgi:hypothetical protein